MTQNNNFLTINNVTKEVSNIKIISTLGQIMFQQYVNNKNEIIVNTYKFNKGTYIVQVNLKDNTHLSVKWIKH